MDNYVPDGSIVVTNTMTKYITRLLNRFGHLISIATLGWVLFMAWRQRTLFDHIQGPLIAIITCFVVLFYGLAVGLLASGWVQYLPASARERWRWPLIRLYARTALAKYLPGNVFHFVGRQLAANWSGMNHLVLARASLLENFSLLCAASIAGSLTWLGNQPAAGTIPFLFILAGGAAAAAIPALLYVLALKFRPELMTDDWSLATMYPRLAPSFTLQVLFFVISGTLFFVICRLMSLDEVEISWLAVFPVYALAWLIGFVTPGAPGGLGVREAILTTFLGGVLGEAVAVQAALLFRLVTVLGDLVFAGLATVFISSYQGDGAA